MNLLRRLRNNPTKVNVCEACGTAVRCDTACRAHSAKQHAITRHHTDLPRL